MSNPGQWYTARLGRRRLTGFKRNYLSGKTLDGEKAAPGSRVGLRAGSPTRTAVILSGMTARTPDMAFSIRHHSAIG
ncbi:hypothetical protein AOR01nite_21300 [Acetobacter orleanensis]|uniref:Uncharacterized protein n=1 Tax=Acetobacter orleanensis TaxID=104099 RepID=A0A4Y3TPJ0_9PROT|nr:hypothetical protein [Acetobacter orleanensis]GAN69914.1 hypothetical protein Abol_221_043 [Acetobacter orleanensis JCM 7639]GEB83653.1 hypothetical protein AOR01nite_21300 [Acetobacter orleanensis]